MQPIVNHSDYFAAIDLGSNSFHMVVAKLVDDHFHIIDRMKESVRLADGLDKSNVLIEAKLQEAIACLQRFGQRIQGFQPEHVKIVGTNTLRKAKNTLEWLDAAEAAVGFPIEIISGIEEARLVYLGVCFSLPSEEQRRLVIDIGGGSTELIVGKGSETHLLDSLYLGCVSISNSFFADGIITDKRWRQAVMAARVEIEPVEMHYRQNWEQAIGSSGTIKTIRNIVQIQGWSFDGISFDSLKKFRDRLLSFPDLKTVAMQGLSEDRRPVIVGGLAVLYALFEALGIQQMLVS